ncbi:MAG: PAS domain S-box protein, partial [Rhodospirillaceae bacterium]|nr:PAS domain S-box protein [Rhodospirillaceae bacterium]
MIPLATGTGPGSAATQRSGRERELLNNQERFRSFAEASSDWFWEMDKDLRFSYFSDRFTTITGVEQGTLMGKTRQETGVPDVDEDAWAKHLENLRLRRPFRRFIHPRTKSDGKVVWLSINGVPVFDESGKFVGYCGNGSDITSQIMMENELEVSRRALEERVTQLELTKAELEERGAKLAKLTRDLKEARDSAEKAN